MTTENLHSEPQENNVNETENIVNENVTQKKSLSQKLKMKKFMMR
jgi:hypothetical protein